MAWNTDLVLEATELWRGQQGNPDKLEGIVTHQRTEGEILLTEVEVLNEIGAEAVGKPIGRYLTLDISSPECDASTVAVLLARELKTMLPEGTDSALVVGLGNRAVTPDAVGPWTVDHLLVTRHLVGEKPSLFGTLRPVAAAALGVLGTTGMESGELASALCREFRPDVVIAVDALAAGSPKRLCRTVQLSDSGIIPGSGIGNARHALTRETLGVPVLAVGVPTVIRAAALTETSDESLDGLIVTPSDIDAAAAELSKLLGWGISLALQDSLTLDELKLLQRL